MRASVRAVVSGRAGVRMRVRVMVRVVMVVTDLAISAAVQLFAHFQGCDASRQALELESG